MASNTVAQFFASDFQPLTIDEATLRRVLHELRAAVKHGLGLIQAQCKVPDATDSEEGSGTIFSGPLGILLMFLRLEAQAHSLSEFGSIDENEGDCSTPLSEIQTSLTERLNIHPLELKLHPGRPSPLCSPSLGAAVLRILACISDTDNDRPFLDIHDDVAALREAVQIAINQERTFIRNGHSMGGDEVLYGRTGLLWALTSIEGGNKSETAQDLQSVLELKSKLINAIMDAGREGGKDYARINGEMNSLPLMWPWLDEYYGLGVMHGSTGILAVLLGCEISDDDNISTIGDTITGLCRICISQNGYLPMSIPSWPRPRPSPLIQICHGTPGLLLLLAAAKATPKLVKCQTSEWNEAVRLGSEKVWEEGLLSKGGGLCHGIAGNAWPWLLLHESSMMNQNTRLLTSDAQKVDSFQGEELSADYFLSRALAFLLAARDTSPFAEHSRYRMPDNPFSLFEGLAGTICAWSEACVIITARLRLMEVKAENGIHAHDSRDEIFTSYKSDALGLPGVGRLRME